MKIDIHVHTKKIKSGDSETRSIEADRFGQILRNTEVSILAITNHNHFDKSQFEAFCKVDSNGCQIWPGIELDVLEKGRRAHLIVIANPKNCNLFAERVESITKEVNPDNFTIDLKKVVGTFDDLDCIYVAHYAVKKPNLGDEEITLLTNLVSNPKRILKEATNSISAGIYISHGHNSIYGSDVQDWDKYASSAWQLPDLRLPVESFEQFCLLLEKDEATINTLLDKKEKETLDLDPFGIAESIRLDIYNDINILFGSKGTGKTKILEALSRSFNSRGHKTTVYKSNEEHLDNIFDIKGTELEINLDDLGIDSCVQEIKLIKDAIEVSVTSISKYARHFSSEEKNKISKAIKIKDFLRVDETYSERKFDNVSSIRNKFNDFALFLEENDSVEEFITVELRRELGSVLYRITDELNRKVKLQYLDYRSVYLMNHIIDLLRKEIERKTGLPKKPSTTGFTEYARNRINIQKAANKILTNIKRKIEPKLEYVGSLGVKGDLYCCTNVRVQDGSFSDADFTPVSNVKKTPQKEFAKSITSVLKHIYSNDLFEKISLVNEVDDVDSIEGIMDLLLFYKHFSLDGHLYNPSHGESSMLLLHRELKEEKDFYLIDEPEKSLGNDYINDVIVPLLKEKASLGKKVIIATHDANIAVRTLPYNSIYRLHQKNQYYTLTGNPFSNKLKCINASIPDLDWKEISMKTLEGGREAFGERGKIYGNL